MCISIARKACVVTHLRKRCSLTVAMFTDSCIQPVCRHVPSMRQQAKLRHRCRTAGIASPSALGAPQSASRTRLAAAPTTRCRHPHQAAGMCSRCQHAVKCKWEWCCNEAMRSRCIQHTPTLPPAPSHASAAHGQALLWPWPMTRQTAAGPTCISDAAVPEPTRPVPPSTST